MLSAFAAGRCSFGINRGMIAERVGLLTAKQADCNATTTYSSHTQRRSSTACATSTNDSAHRPSEATSASLRRSNASANAPPYSPNPTNGTSAKIPTTPTANVE